jgi:hypothetical protein
LIKVMGILFAQNEDNNGETVMADGATFKSNMPIESANGNLLGQVSSIQIVYRAITESSIALAGMAGLSKGVPSFNDANAITGINYLSLEVPFVKIKGTLIDRIVLKEAIRANNLFFGFHGIRKQKIDKTVTSCYIDKITVGLKTAQPYAKVFLDET